MMPGGEAERPERAGFQEKAPAQTGSTIGETCGVRTAKGNTRVPWLVLKTAFHSVGQRPDLQACTPSRADSNGVSNGLFRKIPATTPAAITSVRCGRCSRP